MLTEQIREVFERSDETYGSPRVHAELRLEHGIRVSNKRVARLMREHGFRSVWSRRRRRSTTTSDGSQPAFDLVERDFAADGPDELWVADFSQVVTFSGPAYVAVVEDAWSRYCLGHAVRASKTVDLVLAALEMAIWRRGEMQAYGAIHHTDRGSQGGFNWSLQHLVMEVVHDGCWQASAGDSCDAWPDVVAGPAVGGAA
jgi:putative transposase